MLKHLARVSLFLFFLTATAHAGGLPEGFSYVHEAIPDAVLEVRYHGTNNFVGDVIDGYKADRVILSTPAATALAGVLGALRPFGLGLKVFDGYRPQAAVDHFVRWGRDLGDTRRKVDFYPDVDKKNLFRDGYIAEKSGHTRGSTVDVTIIDLATGRELDMGTPFDYFGPKSWPDNPDMPAHVRTNRALLRQVMLNNGFKPLAEEWWHFTLKDEPYPETYFNFPVQ